MSSHSKWYERTTNGDTERAVATRAGITTSTLNRQLAKGELSMENIVAIARTYGVNPVSALVATEYLTVFEARGDLGDTVQLLPDRVILREIARRIDDDPGAWTGLFEETENHVHPMCDDNINAAIEEANQLRGAAKHSDSVKYTEPKTP